MVLGISGGYCAGKDTAVEILTRYGVIEINEDRIGHEALKVLKPRIIEAFGGGIAGSDGEIDRKALGKVVFADLGALQRLESIVHPWMVDETRRKIAAAGDSRVVINAAILFRMGLHRLCDLVLVIHAPFFIRFFRAKRRDHGSATATLKRMWTQRKQRQTSAIPKQFLNEKGARVDTVVVKNGGKRGALEKRIVAVLSYYGITGW